MKITVLTSSRADFGIQLPLLDRLDSDPDVQLDVIAFGSHLDARFGSTIREVEAAGFTISARLESTMTTDDPAGIAHAIARTVDQFSEVWARHDTDLVISLGDRYEMFAAVTAAVPFGVPIAHLHGGETTIGAIDNAFRHAITHMSVLHFTSTEAYRDRVIELLGHDRGVVNTGALSVDNLVNTQFLTIAEVSERTGVDMSIPTCLITYHPETVGPELADAQWEELTNALCEIAAVQQMIVTLPNADTTGLVLRRRWQDFVDVTPGATAFDSLGSLLYLSCLKHCSFMLGNSSSGYVEGAFFPTWVIDIGNRQTGRLVTPNILRTPMRRGDILEAVSTAVSRPVPPVPATYGDGNAADKIVDAIKNGLAID